MSFVAAASVEAIAPPQRLKLFVMTCMQSMLPSTDKREVQRRSACSHKAFEFASCIELASFPQDCVASHVLCCISV
jgi:hypothetical protein